MTLQISKQSKVSLTETSVSMHGRVSGPYADLPGLPGELFTSSDKDFLGEGRSLGGSREDQSADHGRETHQPVMLLIRERLGKITDPLDIHPTGLTVCRLACHVGGECSSGTSVCRIVAMLHGEVVVDQGLSSLVTLPSVPFETCCVQLRQFSEGMGGRFVDERVLGRELLVETTVGQPRRFIKSATLR